MRKYILLISIFCTIIIFSGCTKVNKPVQTQPPEKESVTTTQSDKRNVNVKTGKPDPRIITTIDADQVVNLIKDRDLSVFKGALNIRSSFVEYEGWIYYYKESSYSDEVMWGESSIYKIKNDGSEVVRVLSTSKNDIKGVKWESAFANKSNYMVNRIDSMKIEDGWIYYNISYGKKYKVGIDGTGNQEVK